MSSNIRFLLSALAEALNVYSIVLINQLINQSTTRFGPAIYTSFGSGCIWLILLIYRLLKHNRSAKSVDNQHDNLEAVELLSPSDELVEIKPAYQSTEALAHQEGGSREQSVQVPDNSQLNRHLIAALFALIESARTWLLCLLASPANNQSIYQNIVFYLILSTVCLPVNRFINVSGKLLGTNQVGYRLALIGTIIFSMDFVHKQSSIESMDQSMYLALVASLVLTSWQVYLRTRIFEADQLQLSVDEQTHQSADQSSPPQSDGLTNNIPSSRIITNYMRLCSWSLVLNIVIGLITNNTMYGAVSRSDSDISSSPSIMSMIWITMLIALSSVLSLAATAKDESLNGLSSQSDYLWGLPLAGIAWSIVIGISQLVSGAILQSFDVSRVASLSLISLGFCVRLFGMPYRWSFSQWAITTTAVTLLAAPLIGNYHKFSSLVESDDESAPADLQLESKDVSTPENLRSDWIIFPNDIFSLSSVVNRQKNQTDDPTVHLWKSRLDPMKVVVSESSVVYMIDTMMLTGHAHIPPLYDALPCIYQHELLADGSSDRSSKQGECIKSQLNIPTSGNFSVLVTIRSSNGSTVYHELSEYPVGISQSTNQKIIQASGQASMYDGHRQIMENEVLKNVTVTSFMTQWCVNSSIHISRFEQSRHVPIRCSFEQAGMSVKSLSELVRFRGVIRGLDTNIRSLDNTQLLNSSYTIAVQIANGSHATQLFESDPFVVLPQQELFERERLALSQYLDRISEEKHSSNQSINAMNQSINQLTRAERLSAPFELASAGNRNGGQCNSAFHQKVSQYREWHAHQLRRMHAVKNNITALIALFTTDPEPVRVIVSQVNLASGMTDRMVGLMSFFTMAMLSKRVILVDNDWPDLYMLMQPSIQLDLLSAAPFLKHPDLSPFTLYEDIMQHQESLQISISDVDAFFTHPISYRGSNRGYQIRLLTENPKYSKSLEELGLTTNTIVACIYHSLWVIRVSVFDSQPAYDEPTAALINPRFQSVGIQIRTGMSDTNTSVQSYGPSVNSANKLMEGGYQGFFHCAHDVSDTAVVVTKKDAVKPLWFLVTDDLALRSSALSRWSNASPKLVSLILPNSLGHSGFGDVSHRLLYLSLALVEHTLFSFCEDHIISSNSGFGRLPAAVALREKQIFVVPVAELVAGVEPLVLQTERMSCLSHERQGMTLQAVSQMGSRL